VLPAASLPPEAFALLALILLGAFTVETALGFGATLIAVAFGSFVLPIDRLLHSLVPLNLGLSLWIAVRHRHAVAWDFLLRRLLPRMALGLPFGLALVGHADPSLLKRTFGVFLVVLSTLELRRLRQPASAQPPALRGAAEWLLLFAGGIIHGAFGTGGPMAVYVTGRALPDKGTYRATLAVLWASLNLALLATFAAQGAFDAPRLTLTAGLLPCCAVGLGLGEWAHRRVSPAAFRPLVFLGLCAAGIVLLVRG
jgi:hypothetical protein